MLSSNPDQPDRPGTPEQIAWLVHELARVVTDDVRTYAVIGRSFTDDDTFLWFDHAIDVEMENRNTLLVAVPEADVVVVAKPLHTVNLCEHVRRDAVVLDMWDTHPYLLFCYEIRYSSYPIVSQ